MYNFEYESTLVGAAAKISDETVRVLLWRL